MASRLNTYENQAKLSVALGVLGLLALAALAVLMRRNFDRATFYMTFNAESMFQPLVGLSILAGLLVGSVGFFVGLNSAGQRRNTKSSLAWKGFFLNAIAVTGILASAIFFYFTRNAVTPRQAGAAPNVRWVSTAPSAPAGLFG